MATARHPGSLLKELDLDKKTFLGLVELADAAAVLSGRAGTTIGPR
jgi:hypothetical protein